jgi:hypothetical protein
MKLFHCSRKTGLNYLTPFATDNLPDDVVYATPHQLFALSMAYGTDKDFNVGFYTNRMNPTEKFFYMHERYRGAFSKLKNKASLYVVDPTNFEQRDGLMKEEVISTQPVKVLKEIKIDNVLDALRRGNCELLLKLKSAVIITGNPAYLKNNVAAKRFYEELQKMLVHEMYIPKVTLDPGMAYTEPPKADLWIGHSRGADRLQFAPKGTFTVAIGDITGIYHPKDNTINNKSKKPVKPNKYHYALTQGMKFQIKKQIAENI